jgi:hypothetical protein
VIILLAGICAVASAVLVAEARRLSRRGEWLNEVSLVLAGSFVYGLLSLGFTVLWVWHTLA